VPHFRITRSDMLRSKIVEPGWYLCEIIDITEEPSKKGDSTNIVVSFKISEGPFADVPLKTWFSEKAMGMAVPFVNACGFEVSEDGGDFNIDESYVGKKLKVEVVTGEYDGRPQNNTNDYAPLSAVLA
jgi:hypothetical protein